MFLETNDPRLTAYLLGELEPEEQTLVEQAIAEQPELRAELDLLRSVIGDVRAALDIDVSDEDHANPPALTHMQREAIGAGIEEKRTPPISSSPFFRQRPFWAGVAVTGIAASLVFALMYPDFVLGRKSLTVSSSDADALALKGISGGSDAAGSAATTNHIRTGRLDRQQRQLQKDASATFAAGSPMPGQGEHLLSMPEALTREKQTLPTNAAEHNEQELQEPSVASIPPAGSDTKLRDRVGTGAALPTAAPGSAAASPSALATRPAPDEAKSAAGNSLYYSKSPSPPAQGGESRTGFTIPQRFASPSAGSGGGGSNPGVAAGGVDADSISKTAKTNFAYSLDSSEPLTPPAPEVLSGDIPILGNLLNDQSHDEESYAPITFNPFVAPIQDPLSTFAVDVDTASYSNVRRFIDENHQMPPADAVRLEEMINYFHYDYPAPGPKDPDPFKASVEVAACPWQPDHRLVRIGIKGKEVDEKDRPATNLVFLIDVSGSMDEPNKLPLVKESLHELVEHLTVDDRVAIVTYAGKAGLALDSTFCSDRQAILDAISHLAAGGSTNGGEGIQLAYKIAKEHFIKGGQNRVILATDGDFNVGITEHDQLIQLIQNEAKSNIFLNVYGFGIGNLKDATLEQLADQGNGSYGYIDTAQQAQKTFVDELSGTLVTIAKDVKIQVEFNPVTVREYRLIGYENRAMAAKDFDDDTRDAGEIGAGHCVTALYEVVPAAPLVVADAGRSPSEAERKASDDDRAQGRLALKSNDAVTMENLRYIEPAQLTVLAKSSGELLTLRIRYKQPDGDTGKLLLTPVRDKGESFENASPDFQFAASVAAYGMLLRGSPYAGNASWSAVSEWCSTTLKDPQTGAVDKYRRQFAELVKETSKIAPKAEGGAR